MLKTLKIKKNAETCIKLWFIDSYKFLTTNLDKLSSFFSKDKRILQCKFCELSVENFDLLTRKGIFPYEYIDCVEKLKETCLLPRDLFYNLLIGDIREQFSIRSASTDLYLKTDVLLLVNNFENFYDSCIAGYGFDPMYYYTSFTWDAMLKHTRINFELLTDIDIVTFNDECVYAAI